MKAATREALLAARSLLIDECTAFGVKPCCCEACSVVNRLDAALADDLVEDVLYDGKASFMSGPTGAFLSYPDAHDSPERVKQYERIRVTRLPDKAEGGEGAV